MEPLGFGIENFMNWSGNSLTTTSVSSDNTSTSPANILSQDFIIWQFNERIYRINFPCVCCLICAIVLGVFGNASAIYVFGFRMKRNNSNVFTAWLSFYDLITSFLLIFETLDKRFPMYSGTIPLLCKIERFFVLFTNSAAAFLLLCIAFDRYIMVCRPLKRTSPSSTRRAIIAAFIVPLICVWPMGIFHGPEIRQTAYEGIYGVDCADDDIYINSIARKTFYFFVLLIILTSIVILTVLYVLIFNAIRKWKHLALGESHRKKLMKLYSIDYDLQMRPDSNGVDIDVSNRKMSKRLSYTPDSNLISNGLNTDEIQLQTKTENLRDLPEESHYKSQKTKQAEKKDVNDTAENNFDKPDTVSNCKKSEQPDANENNLTLKFAFSSRNSESVSKNEPKEEHVGDTNSRRNSNTKKGVNLALEANVSQTERSSFNFDSKGRHPRKPKNNTPNKNSNIKDVKIGNQRKTNVTTLMFFLVSALYIVSFLPTVVVEALNAVGMVYEDDMTFSGKQLLVIANISYFLNGSLNPVIYFVCNRPYRRELINIFTA